MQAHDSWEDSQCCSTHALLYIQKALKNPTDEDLSNPWYQRLVYVSENCGLDRAITRMEEDYKQKEEEAKRISEFFTALFGEAGQVIPSYEVIFTSTPGEEHADDETSDSLSQGA